MLYDLSFIKSIKKCPFCDLTTDQILKSNKHTILTIAKAPYAKNHLLIFPKKHHKKLESLNILEKKDMEKMIKYGIKIISKKHKNFSILYREGRKSGKSIKHLHVHIIPDIPIGPNSSKWKSRKIYSDKIYVDKIKKIKKSL